MIIKRASLRFLTVGIAGCLVVIACNSASDPGLSGLPGNALDATGGSSSTSDGGEGAQSVGDVTIEVAQRLGSGHTLPEAALSARVYNGTTYRVEVTLRFIRDETVVHLAFLTVMPGTVTTVVSPELADEVRVSGIDERGRAIRSADFASGVDFDEHTPVVYRVEFLSVDPAPEPGVVVPPAETPAPSPAKQPEPKPYVEPTVLLIEPADDATLTVGSTLGARWRDSSSREGTVVTIGMRLVDSQEPGQFVQTAPAVGEALDGMNDSVDFVLQGLDEGLYEVVARINDGTTEVTSTAPGRIEVVLSAHNDAPTLTVLTPSVRVHLHSGDSFLVQWDDYDDGDSATITFSLVSTDLGGGSPEYEISPPFAAHPDGSSSDSATLLTAGVLPGLYDLVGIIDDGQLRGVARIEGVIYVMPEPENDAPQLLLKEPAAAIEVEVGQAFQVCWTDSDANDSALISLFLDEDLSRYSMDGDEILLAGAIAEDVDDDGDSLLLGIPSTVPNGDYRVLGLITDGLSQTLSFAPGIVTVTGSTDDGGPGKTTIIDFWIAEPVLDVYLRLGSSFQALTELQVADGEVSTEPTFYLRSTDLDADFRVEVSHFLLGSTSPEFGETHLATAGLGIPNDFMPRSFVLEAEVTVGEQSFIASAEGLVWILQEIDVLEAELVNVQCPGAGPTGGGTAPEAPELSMSWYGGGMFPLLATPVTVDFWLSADGEVPVDGIEDSTHKQVFQTLRSLGEIRSDVVLVPDVAGLDSGYYKLVAAVQTEELGLIVVEAALPEDIAVCPGS